MATLVFALTLAVVVAAVWFVWRHLATGGASESDESVRRLDLGTNGYVAQQAQADLAESGVTVRVVTMEQGAFGIGMGDHYFLVYSTEDHPRVSAVVDALLDEHGLA